MLSFLTCLGLVVALYYASFVVVFIRNYFATRDCGVKTLWAPFDPKHPIWLVGSQAFKDPLQKWLPTWAWKRVKLTIGAHEMWVKRDKYREHQTDTYMLVSAGMNELWTADPEVVADILRRPPDFNQQDLSKMALGIFGSNLAIADGDSWAKQRKLVVGIINERVSKAVFEESHRQAVFMADELATSDIGQHGAASLDGLKKIAINVLSRAGYGIANEWHDHPTSEKHATARSSPLQLDFVTCVKAAVDNLMIAALFPSTLLLGVPSWFPASARLHLVGQAIREYPVHARARIDEERANLSRSTSQTARSSIISQLVLNSDSASSDKKSAGLSEAEINGNLFVFTAAGFDTTANALQFAIALLTAYPDLQNWLYEEILTILDPHKSSTASTENLDYAAIYPRALCCQAFMMEVLRLYPPVIHNIKSNESGKTQVIKTSKVTIRVPPKTIIFPDFVALQTDPKVWRNLNHPSASFEGAEVSETLADARSREKDEYAFRPSRWIVTSSDGARSLFRPPMGSFVAFSAGPRVCPGQKMAQVEFVGVIMTLLRRFRVVANGRDGETEVETRERVKGIVDDVRSELTLVMQRMEELDLRWEERTAEGAERQSE